MSIKNALTGVATLQAAGDRSQETVDREKTYKVWLFWQNIGIVFCIWNGEALNRTIFPKAGYLDLGGGAYEKTGLQQDVGASLNRRMDAPLKAAGFP